ncbi:MAG: RCC1 repeat-containing protein, partial [Myxococcales bacterium]|nr:RCC1 repeat-containing protein [Myxococcales bacterium]
WCWGNNQYGQLGNESTTNSNVPVQAKNLTDVVDLAVGDAFACAVRSNGQVWCWGRNANGQLGQGGTSTASRNVPTQVSGITDAVAVTAGGGDSGTGFACVIRKSGRMSCWGTNFARQLGYSTAGYYSTSPNLADIPQD